jgi:hypothetical protein
MMAKKQAKKKATSKKKVSGKPPKVLLDAVQTLFDQHSWSGSAIGRVMAASETVNCPPGTTPHEITYKLPDGTWVTKSVCLPNTAAGFISLTGDPGTDDDFVAKPVSELPGEDDSELAGDPGKDDN